MAWSCVEPGMYLIAACLLTLSPLAAKIPVTSLKRMTSRLISSVDTRRSTGPERNDSKTSAKSFAMEEAGIQQPERASVSKSAYVGMMDQRNDSSSSAADDVATDEMYLAAQGFGLPPDEYHHHVVR